MNRVVRVVARKDYTLDVTFADGVNGQVDLSTRLFGPVFEPLRDPGFFSLAGIDEYGVVCWPNGADLAPDALYQTLAALVAGDGGRRRA